MRRSGWVVLAVVVFGLVFTGYGFCAGGDLGLGNGSAGSPYLIEDLADFDEFAGDSVYWGSWVYTKLMCDLDLGGRTYNTAVIAWDMDITTYDFEGIAFAGEFDGNSHKIVNLTIDTNGVDKYRLGFFGQISIGGCVADLGLEGVCVTGSGNWTYDEYTGDFGALVGNNSGAIQNCWVSGSVTGGEFSEDVGGICGWNQSTGSITHCSMIGNVIGGDNSGGLGGLCGSNDGVIANCNAEAVVRGNSDIGGLCGFNDEGSITDCYSSGSVEGEADVGGLVGVHYYGIIARSYSSGNVSCGDDVVGGLVGFNLIGDITSSYSSGAVSGNYFVGGITGYNRSGIISNSYSTGSITGSNYVGGFVGHNYEGDIISCYSVGSVTSDYDIIGGLVGDDSDGSITSCYFYLYGGPDNGSGIGLDDEQLQDKGSFAGFDFAGDTSDGSDDNWTIEAGHMPRLTWQDEPGFEAPYFLNSITTSLNGTGYPNDPFVISTYTDMIEFRANPSLRYGYYSLTRDIDLSGVIYGDAFIAEPFSGIFSGNSYVISNLTIDGESYLGFFSELYGFVDNLAIEDVSITGSGKNVGGLVGSNYYGSRITNCYSTGAISGDYFVGGLVGGNIYGSIMSSYSTVAVSGSHSIGGLSGYNRYANISSSYSTGLVTGSDDFVGGLVGFNSNGSICKSYSAGAVSGINEVGGLVGENDGNITDSYSTGEVTGVSEVGGLVGENDGSITNCYSTGAVMGSGDIGGLIGDTYQYGVSPKGCFWDMQTSGTSDGVGNIDPDPIETIGKTTMEMMTLSTFAGWDFSANDGDAADWMMLRENEDYPRLACQEVFAGDIAGLYGVDFLDFGVFAGGWMKGEGEAGFDAGCDFVGDGVIDVLDMAELAENWLAGK